VNPGRQGHDPRRRGATGVPKMLEEFVYPDSQDISKNTQVKIKSRELLQTNMISGHKDTKDVGSRKKPL
jgi:hypothetical protein